MTETWSHEDGKNGAITPGELPEAVEGWGVFRPEPWDFAGIWPTRDAAEQEQERAGQDYEVAFGTAVLGSNGFTVAEQQLS